MTKKLLLPLIAILAVLGCSGNPVVGTWTASSPLGAVSLNFKGDKTYEATVANNPTPVFAGTYAVQDKTVTMTMEKMGGVDVPKNAQTSDSVTLSDDGKTLGVQGMTFTKQ